MSHGDCFLWEHIVYQPCSASLVFFWFRFEASYKRINEPVSERSVLSGAAASAPPLLQSPLQPMESGECRYIISQYRSSSAECSFRCGHVRKQFILAGFCWTITLIFWFKVRASKLCITLHISYLTHSTIFLQYGGMYADFTWMHRQPLPEGEKGQNGWLIRTTCASTEIRNSDSDSGQTANAPSASAASAPILKSGTDVDGKASSIEAEASARSRFSSSLLCSTSSILLFERNPQRERK
jgi:hypothetical protein